MMCSAMDMSRDAYYKSLGRFKGVRDNRAEVLRLVKEIRVDEPRTGTRKLHDRIAAPLKVLGTTIGRDKLFDTLREEHMLVTRKKRYQKTTYSKHEYAVAPNRIKELEITKPNQVLVCDITYVALNRGFAYLFLVTDAFSRKIVGSHLSRDLTHYSALLALDNALQGIKDPRGVIHHTDRGCQYCCHEFMAFLKLRGILSSMTDESHCYQNAIAERVNGILKDEFNVDATFSTFDLALVAVKKAVRIYNTKRTHWSLNLGTPEEVYAQAA